jgi:hypothetical protein
MINSIQWNPRGETPIASWAESAKPLFPRLREIGGRSDLFFFSSILYDGCAVP